MDYEERAGCYKGYGSHFKLTESNFRKIHSVMEDYASKTDPPSKVLIYVERDDASFFETDSIDKILLDENTTGNPISQIVIKIASSIGNDTKGEVVVGRSGRASISFARKDDVKIRAQALNKSRDWCFLLLDELDTQSRRTLRGRSFGVLRSKFIDVYFATLFLSLVAIAIVSYTLDKLPNVESLKTLALEKKIDYLVEQTATQGLGRSIVTLPFMLLLPLVFLAVVELRPVSKMLDIFNYSVFYWGDIMADYDGRQRTQSRIMWGVVIAFIVSIASAYVTIKIF